jgi:hypothetical protein
VGKKTGESFSKLKDLSKMTDNWEKEITFAAASVSSRKE